MQTALVLLVMGSTVTVDSNFTGFEQQLSSPARSDLGKKGWNKCGYAGVTETPVVEFKLTTALEGLELEVGVDSVLLQGDGKLECVKAGQKTALFGTGTRALYFIDRPSAGGAKATVRLFSRAQAQNAAKKAANSALRLTLDGKGPNPRYAAVPASKAVDPREAGLDCVGEGTRIRPVAQLEVCPTAWWAGTFPSGSSTRAPPPTIATMSSRCSRRRRQGCSCSSPSRWRARR